MCFFGRILVILCSRGCGCGGCWSLLIVLVVAIVVVVVVGIVVGVVIGVVVAGLASGGLK